MKQFAVAAALAFSVDECVALKVDSQFFERSKKVDSYTYEMFVEEYGRRHAVLGSAEYHQRASLFKESLIQIHATNAKNTREKRAWRAGLHPFMDWSTSERKVLHSGYKSAGRLHPAMNLVELASTEGLVSNRSFSSSGGLSHQDGPSIRDQGDCGSCWAISATEALEAQLIKQGTTDRVSAQAMVDCVPNPQHCGGSGGCGGATGELAYKYVKDHGIPMETELPYTAHDGQCANKDGGDWPTDRRVRVGGWRQLPSNQEQPLMQSLADTGPTVVAVDAQSWFNYDNGVFDGCARDATLDHAVLAKGYGEDNGRKYWLIQNSWGKNWGEMGHIRLSRTDEAYCGIDKKPEEGLGCDGGPAEIEVCGMCGVLYDPVVPTDVRVESA